MPYDEKELIRKFKEFYERENYSVQISEIASGINDKRSLIINYGELSDFDADIAEMLFDDPETVIKSGESALLEAMEDSYEISPAGIHVRFEKLPEKKQTSIRYLRSSDVGKFIVIEALVKKASEVRPKLVEAAYRCAYCGETHLYPQEGGRITEPLFCKGCDKSRTETRFKLVPLKSKFIDEERLEIQELPEKLEGGQQPQRLVAAAEDDMAGILSPGDRVIINGILRALPRIRGSMKLTTFDFILDVNFIQRENKEYSEIEPDEEEIEEIEEIANSPDVMEKVVGSIAPTVFGMKEVKKALCLQLFGGVSKEMPDGTHIRGDIHILLVGDPGTAKSQLLRYMSTLSPRGVYASGKSASAAGLTAAAVKDEGGDGRWTLEAGALVMADGGIACVDEMDKMSKEDRSAMHEAMEQQTITVVKAGISATLKSRCSLLGAANPKYGRFTPNAESAFEEIDLPAPLISRFDAVFIIRDQPNPANDEKVASHILEGHYIGEKMRQDEEFEGDVGDYSAVIHPDILKKYVSYAKRKNPVMSEAAREAIKKYYVKTRTRGLKEGSIPITARNLEGMIRMAEASARIRLSDIVTEEDAKLAIHVMDYYLGKVLNYDIDTSFTAMSKKTRNRRQMVMEIIDSLINSEGYAEREKIVERAMDKGMSREEVKEMIKKIKDEGLLYEPRNGDGRYKRA